MRSYFLISFCIIPILTYATIINVPADQPTIQAGIDVSIDGDTVLVQPGTYIENINYNGRNITVASLFLTTQDSTYIAMTIINGGEPLDPNDGACVTFKNEEDSTAVLSGFTIVNGSGTQVQIPGGHGSYFITLGGGICCDNSNPCIENIQISGNYSEYGGGIGCLDCSPAFKNISILNNVADSGGGLYCKSSNPNLENVDIFGNCVNENGGGICNDFSDPNLKNVNIIDNLALNRGGGIYWYAAGRDSIYSRNTRTRSNIESTVISGNTAENGGGIYINGDMDINLENVDIIENTAISIGGGIVAYSCNNSLTFSSENRCNIYSNYADHTNGRDIFTGGISLAVILDTFTVLTPTDYYAYPLNNLTFDILNSIEDPLINSNVYVSVDGDDTNSGLSENDAFKTIRHALSRIYADIDNQNTLFLMPGTYSSLTNGENFPLDWINYVSLNGSGEEETILDAEDLTGVLRFDQISAARINNITIINGNSVEGGGINCSGSTPSLENITLRNNNAEYGGGIYVCYSDPIIKDVKISNNSASYLGGGIYYEWHSWSYPTLTNVKILNNYSAFRGGGIHLYGHRCQSNMDMKNVLIYGNNAGYAGGGVSIHESDLSMTNCTISENFASEAGGGFYSDAGQNGICFIELTNCISAYNAPQEIYSHIGNDIITYSLLYSDIYGDIEINSGTVNWLGGCFIQDPFFSGSGDHPFSLQEDSPCIDAGTPDTGGLNLPPWDIIGNHRIWDGNGDENAIIDMGAYEYGAPSFTEANDQTIPNSSLLIDNLRNYPNPFNPETVISFQVSGVSSQEDVELEIYNIKGQKIKTLVDPSTPLRVTTKDGKHTITWNGADDNNQPVSSGIYFYKLKAGKQILTRKMLLLK